MIAKPSKRFFAYMLDEFVSLILFIIILLLTGIPAIILSRGWGQKHISLLETNRIALESFGMAYVAFFVLVIISPVFIQLYFWTKGTSLGKMMLNMRVVNEHNKQPVGFFRMFFREMIGKQISAVVFGLGYISILIDQNHQAWHDKIFNTLVIENTKEK